MNIDIKEVWCDTGDCIFLAQGRGHWQALANTIIAPFIKYRKFLDQPRNYQILKKDLAQWSYESLF
jgi:hypothetical protein